MLARRRVTCPRCNRTVPLYPNGNTYTHKNESGATCNLSAIPGDDLLPPAPADDPTDTGTLDPDFAATLQRADLMARGLLPDPNTYDQTVMVAVGNTPAITYLLDLLTTITHRSLNEVENAGYRAQNLNDQIRELDARTKQLTEAVRFIDAHLNDGDALATEVIDHVLRQ